MARLPLGPPVEGHHYFPRPGTESRAWDLLGAGHDVLLVDPRRVGKSSFLRKLKADARHPAVALTVEAAPDEASVIAALYRDAAIAHPEIRRRFESGALKRFAARIRKVGVAGGELELGEGEATGGWRTAADELHTALVGTGEWLLLVDELPQALRRLAGLDPRGESAETTEGLRRVEAFLAWLRAARQSSGSRVRWMFAGSIGLDTLARRWRLTDQIHDLQILRIGAFAAAEAADYVRWASDRVGVRLTPQVVDAIVEAVGWPIPYHLGLVVQELADRGDAADVMAVPLAVDTLLDRDHRTHFESWAQRLDRQFTPQQAALARRLLAAAAREPVGVSVPHLRMRAEPDFVYLSDALCHDGYLVEAGPRLQFRSPLLRRWWQRHGGRP